jgi:hypothetical protein
MSNRNLNQIIKEDFQRSGLKKSDMERMQIKTIASEEMASLFQRKKFGRSASQMPWACEIPYFDLDGKQTGFSRYRLYDDYIPEGSKKPIKYLQLPGTKSRFYFPPFCDWRRIANDPSVDIYIVEGEKKSASLTKLGFPAIGLGGVWNWRTREDDDTSEMISDFNLINWENRKTIITFDADA